MGLWNIICNDKRHTHRLRRRGASAATVVYKRQVLLAGMIWIVFDMSVPPKATAASGTVGAAIASSTSAKPVMLEFYADWCGPCKEVGPQVEEFAKEMAGKARLIRVNVDEDPRLGQQHGVRGIPAFIVFKNGKETARDVGAISKTRMRELLAE